MVNLHEKATTEVVKTPISMGMLGPGENYSPLFFIQGQQAGTSYCKYLGKSQLDGVEVDVMESGRKKTKEAEPYIVWHFDLARGGVPLKRSVINKDGSLRYETVATSIKRLENGAFICERCVFLSKEKTDWKADIIELTSMDLKPPLRETLSITLPDSCHVICAKDLRQSLRTGKGEKMHVDDLQDWVKKCEKRGRSKPAEDASPPDFADRISFPCRCTRHRKVSLDEQGEPMAFSTSQLRTICLFALLFIGVNISLTGLFVFPSLPYFQLDVVLSPEELADDATREATLALLKHPSNGNQWALWTVAGLLVVAFSALGLYAERIAKRA